MRGEGGRERVRERESEREQERERARARGRESPRESALAPPFNLPGGEFACQWRRHGFDPWIGKILPAVEQLSPFPTTTEPESHSYQGAATSEAGYLETVPCRKRSCHNEKPELRNEEEP